MTDTIAHDEIETLKVDICIPEHEERGSASALFIRTRKSLIEREGGRCWICGRTEEESGHPLEAHHHPVERCFAEEIDFGLVRADALSGHLGPHPQAFDWVAFQAQPDIYQFVDDMTVNGLLLCKDHHTVGNEGIHTLPGPIWLAQRYAKEGVKFSNQEVIHHEQ